MASSTTKMVSSFSLSSGLSNHLNLFRSALKEREVSQIQYICLFLSHRPGDRPRTWKTQSLRYIYERSF